MNSSQFFDVIPGRRDLTNYAPFTLTNLNLIFPLMVDEYRTTRNQDFVRWQILYSGVQSEFRNVGYRNYE